MSNVAHMHEMIDALFVLAEDEDPFLASVAKGGLRIVEESLRSASKTISNFKTDSNSADDLPQGGGAHCSECETLSKMISGLHELSNDNRSFVKDVSLGALKQVADILKSASEAVTNLPEEDLDAVIASLVTPESLKEMVTIASEFDKTGDPLLMKQAAVLDEILLTIGAHKGTVAAIRRSQDEEISRIKAEASESREKDPYTLSKKVHDKSNNVAEGQAAIQKIKDYRPMEAPLNTRTCPDHPGAQMARVAEGSWQCSLDKGIYNYENGYTTMKGNKVPGGDVSNQTQALYDRPNEFTSFETRENKLSPN